MRSNAASRLLWAVARERGTYHSARFRVFARLWMHRSEAAQPLSPYLSGRFLGLSAGWQVLDFKDRDWANLAALRGAPDALCRNYIDLALAYINANAERVRFVQHIHNACSAVLLGDDPKKISGILGTLDEVDEQSIFVFKLQGLIKSDKDEKGFVDYLRDPKNADWVKRRLLYPLVYHTVNTPTDDYLDTFLSYMLPQDDTGGIERAAVRHILRDDLSFAEGLAYRAYIGLLSHPFDALESFINAIEIEFCKSGALTATGQSILDALAENFPTSRASRLKEQINRIGSADGEGWPRWAEVEKLPANLTGVLTAFVDCAGKCPEIDQLPTEEWKALCRMRWSRYPIPDDFDVVVSFIRSWTFTEAGRLFSSLMTSMYMVTRDAELPERRKLFRLHRAVGQTTPYLWASPRGQWLMKLQMRGDRNWLGADLRAGVDLGRRLGANDRTWFHAVHWKLEKAERLSRVREWLGLVRQYFPVRPMYLTGIDWRWVDRVLPKSRITPFRENPDGPFALLLRSIEERQQDETLLRTAVEPLTRGRTCGEFVDELMREYGQAAVAFVRFFLTPETIMLLGLAPNMTAALSERISALEHCATEFRFNELLNEGQLRQEQQTLTSALMLLNVNANQFDIPWASFQRDASNRQQDNYNAYDVLRKADRTRAVINDHNILYAHRFANSQTRNYKLASSSATLAVVILGIIDTFIDHPSYGIEAILSTRFRHDTLRREFVFAFDELESSHVQGIVPQEQREIVRELATAALDELDSWLSKHMQTLRPGFDESLFDFTPTEEELALLMAASSVVGNLDDVIGIVRDWLMNCLELQLQEARRAFLDDFLRHAGEAVVGRAGELQAESQSDPQIIQRLTSATADTVSRRAESLVEWFRMPSADAQKSLTFGQVEAAVEGRFERYVTDGRLKLSPSRCEETQQELRPEKVRLYFDLLSEVIQNAVKYGEQNVARVRVRPYSDEQNWGLIYSSPAACGKRRGFDVPGDPYRSLTDALFREGNSGLEKIAALSASIVGSSVSVRAQRRPRCFHLQVPLGGREKAISRAAQ